MLYKTTTTFVYPAVEICRSLRQFIQFRKPQQALSTAMSIEQTNSKWRCCCEYLVHMQNEL